MLKWSPTLTHLVQGLRGGLDVGDDCSPHEVGGGHEDEAGGHGDGGRHDHTPYVLPPVAPREHVPGPPMSSARQSMAFLLAFKIILHMIWSEKLVFFR